jgi:methylaspartate mutase sigma subunit
MEAVTVITGVIGLEDPHVIGSRVLSYALEKAGFKVVALGAKCSQEEFISAATETAAKAILVSSVAGMGELNCRGFRDMCREAGLDDILLYIGGNIVIGKQDPEEIVKRFKSLGFDRVYPPGTKPSQAIRDLRTDLGLSDK